MRYPPPQPHSIRAETNTDPICSIKSSLLSCSLVISIRNSDCAKRGLHWAQDGRRTSSQTGPEQGRQDTGHRMWNRPGGRRGNDDCKRVIFKFGKRERERDFHTNGLLLT